MDTFHASEFDEFDQFGEMIDEKAAASSSSSSKKSSKSPSTKKGQQLLTPVTIAQVLGAEAIAAGHNQFTIDGKIMSQVAIVGLIMKVEDQQTHETFTIDDSTNQIDVQHYKDKEQNAKQTPFSENMYVRVVGRIVAFNGKRRVFVHQMRPVVDFNEITCHCLEVIHAHLLRTVGRLDHPEGKQPQQQHQQQQHQQQGHPPPHATFGHQQMQLSSAEERVYNFLSPLPNGASEAQIHAALRMPRQEVDQAIQSMKTRGFLFNADGNNLILATIR